MSRPGASEQRLAWCLCAPAVIAMLVVTAYPVLYSLWLSLFRYDLRFPDERKFIGLENYLTVLSSPVWWQSFFNTALVTVGSVAVELVLGLALEAILTGAAMDAERLYAAIFGDPGDINRIALLA